MRRKPRLPRAALARRLKASEVPMVPTCQPDHAQQRDEAVHVAPALDDTEETVRRMVEAAYT